MTDEEAIQHYTALFRGRGDACGNWKGPGSGTANGPLTAERIAQHLTSQNPDHWIGVYPHLGAGSFLRHEDDSLHQQVSWGCIDIDGKDFGAVNEATNEIIPETWDWPEMWRIADQLQAVLAHKEIWAHTEQTDNGIHLWTFPTTPTVSAIWMRRAQMAACTAIGYAPKEVNPKQETLLPGQLGNYVRSTYPGGLNGIERFSTQTNQDPPHAPSQSRSELDGSQPGVVGGTVGGGGQLPPKPPEEPSPTVFYRPADDGQGRRRPSEASGWCGRCGNTWGPIEALPRQKLERHLHLEGASVAGSTSPRLGASPMDGRTANGVDSDWPRRVFITPDHGPICVECFVGVVKRTDVARLEEVSQLWTPPVQQTFDGPPPEDVAPIIETLAGLAYTIWKDGPLEGRDRSNTLAKLAYQLRDDGLPMPMAFAVVKDADARWGKMADRPDCDEQIMKIIQLAYTE